MDDQVYKAKEEIRDLEELLPEIQAKYEDAREMELEHSEASQAVKEASENLHRSPVKNPAAKAGGSSSVVSSSSSSFAATAFSAGSSSSDSKSNGATKSSAFTAPFPRDEEESCGSKITFGSRSSGASSSGAPAGVNMIGVRRNLNKEPESSAGSSSSFASSSFASSTIPSGAVNDISCLVRRKRKPEEQAPTAATPAVQTNGASAGSGDAALNGDNHSTEATAPVVANGVEKHTNGVEKMPEAKRVKTDGDA